MNAQSTSPLFTVAICTRNRAAMLRGALESVCGRGQEIDAGLYEVLVVDNASTDETAAVAAEFAARHANVRVVRENTQGLSHARNRAWREARGRFVAYLDDDAKAATDWLAVARRCIEEGADGLQGLGGPIRPWYAAPKPDWFPDKWETRSWGKEPRFLNPGESFSGSNMFFARDLLESYGGFPTGLGVRGEALAIGEETAFCRKVWKGEEGRARFYYEPGLLVYHAVPAFKMRVGYRLKRIFAYGQAWFTDEGPRGMGRLGLALRLPFRMVHYAAIAIARRKRYAARQVWIVEELGPILCELGRLLACLGLRPTLRQG